MILRAARPVVAALLVAAAWVGLPVSAAHAAACSSSTGVTVVVDFNDLGGGVASSCAVGGGGKHASELFPAVGEPLTYASRQPGFVCRVAGVPASDPCVNTSPADAYWGLWWSDGDPGSGWTYATLGAGSLTIPDGGIVAFSWDDVSGDEQPSAPSTRPAATVPATPSSTPTSSPTTSSPTRTPSSAPTRTPSEQPTTSTPSATGSPTRSAAPSSPGTAPAASPDAGATPTPSGTATRVAKPRVSRTATTEPVPDTQPSPASSSTVAVPITPGALSAQDPDQTGSAVPIWIVGLVILVLFGAGTVAAVRRKRSSP